MAAPVASLSERGLTSTVVVPRAVKLVADAQENGAIRLLDERAQFVNCRVVCAIGDVIEVLSRVINPV